MKKSIGIYSLLVGMFLVSCQQGKNATKDKHLSRSLSDRMTSYKKMEFDKEFFDGIQEKLVGNYQNALQHFEDAAKTDENNAAAYYEIANAEVQLNRISDAEKASEKAVALDNGENKWYLMQLSDIYRFEKKWSQAATLYEKLIKNDPDNVENYFRLAAIDEAQGKITDALKVYDKIETNFGVSDEVVLQKTNLYVQTKKYDKAIIEIEKLIKSDPENPKFYQLLAETYLKAGNEPKAMEVYDQLMAKNPNDGETQLALAEYYFKKGNREKSFEMLKKAFANKSLSIDSKISILYNDYLLQPKLDEEDRKDAYILTESMVNTHPDDAKGHAIFGDFLYQDKKYDEARIQYRKSLETKKNVFAVWQQLLLSEAELKDFKALAEESDKALDYFPNQPSVYFLGGVANIQLKNYKKAATTLESGLNQIADNPALEVDFYANLAEAYYRMNDNAKSDSYFDKALAKDPNNVTALNNYAYYLSVRDEKLDKAEEMSKKTLEKEPENASYLDTYGWILYKRGKFDEAAKYIRQSLDKEKQSAEVNEHYGDVQYKLGNVDIAVEYWKYAKQYGSDSVTLDKKIANHKIVE